MKKIFVDTNILVDLITNRKPFGKFAEEIFRIAGLYKIKLYASSHSFATIHYLLKKYIAEKELRENLYNLLDYISIIPISLDILKKGLKSKHRDFEDALQIIAACSVDKMDCIVTRDIKDFKDAAIPVIAPDELVQKYLTD